MRLWFSPTSPYTRKITVTAHETGLHDRIERIIVNPWATNENLYAANPLGKVPTLLTDDGVALYDSPVICEYLDSLHDGPRLLPTAGPERWQMLRQQALADGIIDAAVYIVLERLRRPEAYRWPEWITFQQAAIRRGLAALETDAAAFGSAVTMARISVGCVLGYLDFRLSEENWRAKQPVLAAWYVQFSARPSMQATVPQEH